MSALPWEAGERGAPCVSGEGGTVNTRSTGSRRASRQRVTNESDVMIEINLDGDGSASISTGLPFFDHMLAQLARHSGMDLVITTTGDLVVDSHHSVEDTGITLGQAFAEALGDKAGIRRFASRAVPLDETLVNVALDCSGRPYLHYEIPFPPDVAPLGTPGFDPQLAEEFWRAFVTAAQMTLHVSLAYGKNTHHIVEASFKGVARCLGDAIRVEGNQLPSTKGVL
jgi:imidazoleglycerol-phosphate dehydratase